MLACVTAFEGLVSGRWIGTLIGTCALTMSAASRSAGPRA